MFFFFYNLGVSPKYSLCTRVSPLYDLIFYTLFIKKKRPNLKVLHVDQSKAMPLIMVPDVDFVIPENFSAQVGDKDIMLSSFFCPTKKMKWYHGQNTFLLLRLQSMIEKCNSKALQNSKTSFLQPWESVMQAARTQFYLILRVKGIYVIFLFSRHELYFFIY